MAGTVPTVGTLHLEGLELCCRRGEHSFHLGGEACSLWLWGERSRKMQRFSRRTFIAWVGGAGAGFYLFGRLPGFGAPTALAQIPGGTLDPTAVPKFATAMLIPPVMPRADTITAPGGKPVDYYEISMRQFSQQILPAGLPATTVWGYGAVEVGEQARASDPPRAVADHRVQLEPAGAGQVDQRARGCERELPAAPAARSTPRCTGPTRPAVPTDATRGRRSRRRPARTPARCRS